MYIQYVDLVLGIYMIYLSLTVNASYTTELVVELATIGRVNISSDISIHLTVL